MIDRKIHETEEITPNNIPFKCPVCNGFGTLKHGTKQCHGCKGKGYVVISNDRQKDEHTLQR